MLGKRRSCRGFAIRPRVQISTGEIQKEIDIQYVIVVAEVIDLIVQPGST